MIPLSDLYLQLQSAELNQQSITGRDGIMVPEHYNRVVALANLGLVELYRKFDLRQGSLILRTQANIYTYELIEDNALSNNLLGFIIDTNNPFMGDVLQIRNVLTTNGHELLLNNYNERHLDYRTDLTPQELGLSFFTPNYRTLRIPAGIRVGTDIVVRYRSSPPAIPLFDENINQAELDSRLIPLPPVYLNALIYYIAARIGNGRDAATMGRSVFHVGNNFEQKYKAEIAELEKDGVVTTTLPEMRSHYYRGFP